MRTALVIGIIRLVPSWRAILPSVASLLLLCCIAYAQDRTPAASFIGEIRQLAAATSRGDDAAQRALRQKFDFPGMAKLVLRDHWDQASARDRSDFIDVISDLTMRAVIRRIGPRSTDEFEIKGQRSISGSDMLVTSTLVLPTQRVSLDWRLRPGGGSFRVVDVYIDGKSTVVSRREEFAGRLHQNGNSIATLVYGLREELSRSAN